MNLYPLTLSILKDAYRSETTASLHYKRYSSQALVENYPNIAYLFHALSVSEKIHADNYQTLITLLGSTLISDPVTVFCASTQKNLNTAAMKELEKIKTFYPEILKKLSAESHPEAVKNCLYSWKSHQQHRNMISDIKKYSGIFFKPLARKIESMTPDYHVCKICGSTIVQEPKTPCEICNLPLFHYQKIQRPQLSRY